MLAYCLAPIVGTFLFVHQPWHSPFRLDLQTNIQLISATYVPQFAQPIIPKSFLVGTMPAWAFGSSEICPMEYNNLRVLLSGAQKGMKVGEACYFHLQRGRILYGQKTPLVHRPLGGLTSMTFVGMLNKGLLRVFVRKVFSLIRPSIK